MQRTFALVLACLALLCASACEQVAGVDFGSARLRDDRTIGIPTPDGGVAVVSLECGKACKDYGFECGAQTDPCEAALDCGTCADGKPCINGKCGCQPKSCADLGAQCGATSDGCGGLLDCGTCANPSDVCADNKCACKGKTCVEQGAECGTVPDGCGQTYACVGCGGNPAGPECGGGGPGKCGPTPCVGKSCAEQGKNCGQINNGCGVIIDCGNPCVAPASCGGAGVANVCGCRPTTCAIAGAQCGQIPDGCGGTLDCGGCAPPNNTCTGNRCSCTVEPDSCSECCTRVNGFGINNCGTQCTNNTCCGGAGCFGAGTPVRMADGSYKPIEQVQPGDRVASYDRVTGLTHAAVVLERKVHGPETSAEGFLVRRTAWGTLRVTPNHPLLIDGKRARADTLKAGSRVSAPAIGNTPVSLGANMLDLRTVPEVLETAPDRVSGNGEPTYDLAVDGSGTFFAANVLVLQKQIP